VATVVGIDEAGLSPVLGPLVLSAMAMEVPDDKVSRSLWRLLGGAVGRKGRRRTSALAIDDSKKLYSASKPDGMRVLERGVLAMLSAWGHRPTDVVKLLELIAPGLAETLAAYPWYAERVRPLPRCAGATDIALAGNALQRAMAGAGVRTVGVRCQPILAGEYNRLVAASRNKARTLFDVVSRLLVWAWRLRPGGRTVVHVDRLGGRQRYLPSLQRVFDGARLKVVEETPTRSAYIIAEGDRWMRVSFAVGGDSRQLLVALASMMSKYVRELFMEALNGFWSERMGDLKRTSGYHSGGRQFYDRIDPMVRRMGVDRSLLLRTR